VSRSQVKWLIYAIQKREEVKLDLTQKPKQTGKNKSIDSTFLYLLEKSLYKEDVSNKLWLVFGKQIGRSLRDVYIAIRVLHTNYANRNFEDCFYCSIKRIAEVAFLSEKQAGKYVRALQKLGLIYRWINPGKKEVEKEESLKRLIGKFEKKLNKKTSFFKVFRLSNKVILNAQEKTPEVKKWLILQSEEGKLKKQRKRTLKKLEETMTEEEKLSIKSEVINA